MKNVFLISGKMASGKNQFSDFLNDIYRQYYSENVELDYFAKDMKQWSEYDFKSVSDCLNNIAKSLLYEIENIKKHHKSYGLSCDGFTNKIENIINGLFIKSENWFENKTNITRLLLQIYGTQIFRDRVDDLFWIKRVKQRIIESKSNIIIITDVRFPNEIDYISDSHFYSTYSIRINRTLNRNGKQHEHHSETALDNYKQFSYTIDNNNSLGDLEECAHTLIRDIKKQQEENETNCKFSL